MGLNGEKQASTGQLLDSLNGSHPHNIHSFYISHASAGGLAFLAWAPSEIRLHLVKSELIRAGSVDNQLRIHLIPHEPWKEDHSEADLHLEPNPEQPTLNGELKGSVLPPEFTYWWHNLEL